MASNGTTFLFPSISTNLMAHKRWPKSTLMELVLGKSMASISAILFSRQERSILSMEDNPKAFTVSDLVGEIKKRLVSPFDIAMFEKKLANVGYFDEDDYSADRWTEGETSIFEVRGEFPRITSENCPAGIMKVKYQIDLSCCQDYLANEDSLLGAMG